MEHPLKGTHMACPEQFGPEPFGLELTAERLTAEGPVS
jgi:hypothetical protein